MLAAVERRFREVAPAADFVSLRLVEERSEVVSVRQGVLEPTKRALDVGAMITVLDGGGCGYAATSDLSSTGLARAADRALTWAQRSAGRSVVDFRKVSLPRPAGDWEAPVQRPWDSLSLKDKVALVQEQVDRLKIDPRVVDWEGSLWYRRVESRYLTAGGASCTQVQHLVAPGLSVTASEGGDVQVRSLAFGGDCRQGGLEILDAIGFFTRGPGLAEEALQLLSSPNCPDDTRDLLLMPDQMMLQIHESIGHPLELDRILGDERNYAGTSFVTADMFGAYQYGSALLHVSFDPSRPDQFASYGYDDDGAKAERVLVIDKGLLVRPLGGTVSQARAGLEGTANSRACSWNRPPIDRMANLNVEPGESTLDDMVRQTERGVLMQTNTSWSIDDSRNKFQFGCELGRLIEDGELKGMVKNPNYRGVSASFWRSLAAVGRADEVEVLGTPFCGKGEPNQAVHVGHASPPCLFTGVQVFGGDG
jgi:predicted Zn-dependent protease